MGGGPLAAALPMVMSMFGGSAQAAPAGGAQQPPPVSPFSAGLMGQPPGGGQPPVPERNPMMSDPAGQARGAAMIQDKPELKGLFAQAMSQPRGGATPEPGPQPQAAPIPPQQGGDSTGSFASQPWKRESVFGKDVTGQNWQPSKGQITLPQQQSAQPLPAATAQAAPAPERNPSFHDTPQPAGLFGEQQFDTAKPATKPGPGGMFDFLKGPMGTAQEKLKGVPTNPMAQVGLSLLSSGYDGSNPYKQIQSSLGGIPNTEIALRSADIADAASKRAGKKEVDAEKDAEMTRLLNQIMLLSGGAPPAQQQGGLDIRQAQGQARAIR